MPSSVRVKLPPLTPIPELNEEEQLKTLSQTWKSVKAEFDKQTAVEGLIKLSEVSPKTPSPVLPPKKRPLPEPVQFKRGRGRPPKYPQNSQLLRELREIVNKTPYKTPKCATNFIVITPSSGSESL